MKSTPVLFLMIFCLLNGAFFNRIGSRIAERSYMAVLYSMVLDNLGIEHQLKNNIKVAKRVLPGSNQSGNSLFKKQINNDNEHTYSNAFSLKLSSTEVFSYGYADDITEAHKPPIFKPPS